MSDRAKKRAYTTSPATDAQRRGAAWKHGLYAESALGQVLPPCRRGTCPLGPDRHPCSLRQAMDDREETLERCPLPLVLDEEVVRRYQEALAEGDPTKIQEGQARALAMAAHLRDKGLVQLLEDGLSINLPALDSYGKPIYDHDGNPVLAKAIQHPATYATLELLKHTGATAAQQALTPQARGERDRDVSIAEALSWSAKKRRELEESAAP